MQGRGIHRPKEEVKRRRDQTLVPTNQSRSWRVCPQVHFAEEWNELHHLQVGRLGWAGFNCSFSLLLLFLLLLFYREQPHPCSSRQPHPAAPALLHAGRPPQPTAHSWPMQASMIA